MTSPSSAAYVAVAVFTVALVCRFSASQPAAKLK